MIQEVEHLPSMLEALGSILSAAKIKQNQSTKQKHYSFWIKPSLAPVFVNKFLLEHSHTHLILQIKFYWNRTTPICLRIVCGSFHGAATLPALF
jgi:hypothetical protein